MTSRTSRLRGLVAATFAPMHDDGALCLEKVPGIVDSLAEGGVDGLFVSGTTGEAESLTVEEREAIAERYISAADGRLPTVVHVGSNCLRSAARMAAHAQAAGAAAIAMTSPSYFRPRTVRELVDCCAEVARGAPELPLYYYHLPQVTGVDLDMVAFLEDAPRAIPNLGGLKFSAIDVVGFQACAEFQDGRYDVLWGCDQLLLTGLCSGARGAVGSTYNFMAPFYRRVIDAFERGALDEAARWQRRAVTLVDVLFAHGGLPAFKAAMELRGQPCGPVRLPSRILDASQKAALREALTAAGFFAAD